MLQMLAGGTLAGLVTERERIAQAQVAHATHGLPSPKIKDVSVIATAPAGLRLTAESLAGRRNRIGTVTVERTDQSDGAVSGGQPAAEPVPEAGPGPNPPGRSGNGQVPANRRAQH